MTYYAAPSVTPRLHTVTKLADADPWVAFREACEGGGTPPHWTQQGDDPQDWAAPSDAAGGLILWCADGALWRVEPQRSDPEQIAAKALADLQDAAGTRWADWDGTYVPRAAYYSCGGRAVLLLDPVASGTWLVAVFRCEDTPRRGASEENMARIAPCVVEVMP